MVLIAIITRPILPIDETRYASVAWEMWLRKDFLVPYLNAAPYSHKPPLLFWLIHIGWWIFGVNDWWPRLIPPLFGLANLYLTMRLARLLWPARTTLQFAAPVIVIGSLLWTIFTTVLMFDMLVVFFTLLALYGIVDIQRYENTRGWFLLAIAIGLGLLAKGPVVLLYILPPALLAPWWTDNTRPRRWAGWYSGVLGAVIGGTAIALLWALPAALAAGEEYRNAIFFQQTAGRLVRSFAHPRPWWWYVVSLPAILFPWFFWPPLWRGLTQLRRRFDDSGIRFCLAWIVPAFTLLSAINNKQAYYLLPLFPAFALLSARLLESTESRPRRWDLLPLGLALVLIGGLFAAIPILGGTITLPVWTAHLPPTFGLVVILIGLAFAIIRFDNTNRTLILITTGSALLVTMFHLTLLPAVLPAYDVAPVAKLLRSAQQKGRSILNLAKYHGEFHFIGRLEHPLDIATDKAQLQDWIAAHPLGLIVAYTRQWHLEAVGNPLYSRAYRGKTITIWQLDAKSKGPITDVKNGEQMRHK